jgi:hypothetical protein
MNVKRFQLSLNHEDVWRSKDRSRRSLEPDTKGTAWSRPAGLLRVLLWEADLWPRLWECGRNRYIAQFVRYPSESKHTSSSYRMFFVQVLASLTTDWWSPRDLFITRSWCCMNFTTSTTTCLLFLSFILPLSFVYLQDPKPTALHMPTIAMILHYNVVCSQYCMIIVANIIFHHFKSIHNQLLSKPGSCTLY